ncbi:hypothetical protein [Rhodocaloribacter sp.]
MVRRAERYFPFIFRDLLRRAVRLPRPRSPHPVQALIFLGLAVLPGTCVTDIERKPFSFFPDAAMRNPINQAIRNMTFGAGIVSLLVLTVFILL